MHASNGFHASMHVRRPDAWTETTDSSEPVVPIKAVSHSGSGCKTSYFHIHRLQGARHAPNLSAHFTRAHGSVGPAPGTSHTGETKPTTCCEAPRTLPPRHSCSDRSPPRGLRQAGRCAVRRADAATTPLGRRAPARLLPCTIEITSVLMHPHTTTHTNQPKLTGASRSPATAWVPGAQQLSTPARTWYPRGKT